MSKKILAALALCISASAMAAEQVKIIWPFGPVAATNTYRNIIDQANAAQNQYSFVLDHATGGGGTVAVNAVANSSAPTLLAHSAAFFVNPKISPTVPYNVNDWRMVKHICDIPYPLASVKYRTMKDVPTNRPVTVGVLGLGTTTHLVQQYFAQYYPNMVAVPYKTATAALTDVLGGHLDMTVSLPGDVMGQYEAGKINVLGVTGAHAINRIPTFASQGFVHSDKLVGGYFIFAHRKTDPEVVAAWQRTLDNVDQKSLNSVAEKIYCTPTQTKTKDLDLEFVKSDAYWAYLSVKGRGAKTGTLAAVDKPQK